MAHSALITGATGFVGGHLVRELAAHGWAVRALVRPSSDVALLDEIGAERVVGSLGDTAALRRAVSGVDVVFHLAAVTAARTRDEYARVNAEGTANLVDAVAGAERPPGVFVYLSSYAAAGPSRPGHPRAAAEEPAPLTAYGRTKLEGEQSVQSLGKAGARVVVVRAPAVYGPGDRALLPYFRLVRMGVAPIPAGGERKLHMIFAPDLAQALVRAAAAEPGMYPVAGPAEHSWEDVVAAIALALGRKPLRLPVPAALVRAAAAVTETAGAALGRAPQFNRDKAAEMLAAAWTCDLSGSERLLPATEATSLAEGMEATVRWYKIQGWI